MTACRMGQIAGRGPSLPLRTEAWLSGLIGGS